MALVWQTQRGRPSLEPSAPADERANLLAACARSLLACDEERFWVKDLQSRYVAVSDGWLTACVPGARETDVVGRSDAELFDPESADFESTQRARAADLTVLRSGAPLTGRVERADRPGGHDAWVLTSRLPLRDEQGEIIGLIGFAHDVTPQVLAEQDLLAKAAGLSQAHADLERAEKDLRTTLEISPDAIARYDDELRYVYLNPAAARLTRVSRSEAVGQTDRDLSLRPELLEQWEQALRQVLLTGRSHQSEFSTGTAGEQRWFQAQLTPELSGDGVIGVLTSIRELTSLKRAEQELVHQALHDPVTGLANRTLLFDRLSHAILQLRRSTGRVAVLVIDLDRFKVVNDQLGHDRADQLLVEVGRRLGQLSRQIDTVARFGGDEFVLLCDNLSADDDVRLIAGRVVRALAEPFSLDGEPVAISASVGVVLTVDGSANVEDLLRDADAAMYQAKERGRNRFQLVDHRGRSSSVAAHSLEVELVAALDRGEFRLHYQPQIRLVDHRLVGVEALVRWDHPQRGLVAPAGFIGVAEDRGLIVPLGRWVLTEACRQLAEWSDLLARRGDAPGDFVMAVNVSGRQLREDDFVETVVGVLNQYGLPARSLCLEITETALIEEAVEAKASLEALAALGVHLALDDFGTGYSSLAHLRSFPVDVLKIDKSFVDRVADSDREREIIAAVTAMAQVLGMTVVGEGIESQGQLEAMTALGCDEGQGYLLDRPMPAAELAVRLADGVATE